MARCVVREAHFGSVLHLTRIRQRAFMTECPEGSVEWIVSTRGAVARSSRYSAYALPCNFCNEASALRPTLLVKYLYANG